MESLLTIADNLELWIRYINRHFKIQRREDNENVA